MDVNGALILDVGVGLGCLLAGVGVLVAFTRLGRLCTRVERTLDEVDRQVATISVPVTDTLSHIEGIAGTADATIAKVATIVQSVETVANSVAKTSNLAQHAVAPTLVNLAATLTGISAGLRKLVGTNNSSTHHSETE